MLCYFPLCCYLLMTQALHLCTLDKYYTGAFEWAQKWRRNEFWYGQWMHTAAWVGEVGVCVFWKEDKPVNRKYTVHELAAAFMPAPPSPDDNTCCHSCNDFFSSNSTSFNGATRQPRLRCLSFLDGACASTLMLLLLLVLRATLAWWSTNGCWFALLLVLSILHFIVRNSNYLEYTRPCCVITVRMWVCTPFAALQLHHVDINLLCKLRS